MNPTKTERDQWRERLASPYTCFDAAHADFTIRLLDALDEAEADQERLEREADWLAHKLCEAVDALMPESLRIKFCVKTVEEAREAAREAVEEGR